MAKFKTGSDGKVSTGRGVAWGGGYSEFVSITDEIIIIETNKPVHKHKLFKYMYKTHQVVGHHSQ